MDGFNAELEQRARGCGNRILEVFVNETKTFNERYDGNILRLAFLCFHSAFLVVSIIVRYEQLAKRLLEKSGTVDDFVNQQNFLKESRVTEVRSLDDDVENAKKR